MAPGEIPEALDALLEPSETIGDFDLLKGWGPKPIDFGPIFPIPPITPEFVEYFNYRMWNDYQWSMRICPPAVDPFIITGV